MRVALIAGETSGDRLGADLIAAIRTRLAGDQVVFEGVAGPRMCEAGCRLLAPMESLSVMGLTEVVKHLPRLLRLRRRLLAHWSAHPPDVFVGIDSPDFNLGVARKLRNRGVRTVQYVSPTIWAWRPERVHGIARAVDEVLCIYPFEPPLYHRHGYRATYVGHPLADAIAMDVEPAAHRKAFGLPPADPVVAVLPGSRASEVSQLAGPFVEAMLWIHEHAPSSAFIAPMANPGARRGFEKALSASRERPPVTLVDGQSQEALAACDIALVASGTATLEAMLFKRPLVIAYRVSPLTFAILKRLVRIERIGLPNILGGEDLAPEFVQQAAQGELMGDALLALWRDRDRCRYLRTRFEALHRTLRCEAGARAAEAVIRIGGKGP